MKVGVNLINFGPGANPKALKNWVQLVEGLGYHLIMTSDHIAMTPDVQSRYPAPFYEPISTLGWLSGITDQIQIGTTVIILPYRNVIETARACANIDQLSNGRFILGVGIGWAEQEFQALGINYSKRGAITNEYLEALHLLWEQDRASFEGRFVSFTDIDTAPRPIQTPAPPIWVGGPSDAALKRAVLWGDAWHPIRIRTDWLRDTGIPHLKEIAERENRPVPDLCPRIRLYITDQPLPNDKRVAGEGDLDQVHRDLAELEQLGCPYVVLDNYFDDPEAMRHHESSWRMLSQVAETIIDLPNQTVR